MSQNVYEALFIFDSNRFARDAGGVSGAVSEMVEKIDGEILADRLWVEQKLAYPIKGYRKGSYWLTYFRAEGAKLAEFNRLCRLNDNILRHMVIKIDHRLVDAFVSHALGTKQDSPSESKSDDSSEGKEKTPSEKPASEKPASEEIAKEPATETAEA